MPEVTITVTANNTPVSGATVAFSPNGSIATTNSGGVAVVTVAPGQYTLTASHKNYQGFQGQVTIPSKKTSLSVSI